jgi:hypothetical protein
MMSDESIRSRSRWFTRDNAQAPLAHRYSIVARDVDTRQLGVAVQSHCFAVGSIAIWTEAEVGAVATQSVSEPAYGALGLDLMRAGVAAPDTLNGLLSEPSIIGCSVRRCTSPGDTTFHVAYADLSSDSDKER